MAGNKRECVVQRATGYTVMSNYHLRDKALGLKAKGLLSVMLSLPDDWDYTIAGLAVILDEGKHVIRTAVQELEKAGYITRQQLAGEGGKFGGNQYIIREFPEKPETSEEVCAPLSNFPTTENPMTENPMTENCTEIITDEQTTDEHIPPKSPEKPKAERKARKPKTNTVLTDAQTEELIRQNVATLGDASGWGRDDKNAVYKLAMEFYQPRDCGGSPPRHTTRGINGLFRRLSEYSRGSAQVAKGLLDTAIERGWTSVYPEKGARPSRAPAPAPDDGNGVYKRL